MPQESQETQDMDRLLGEKVGAELFREMVATAAPDAYQRNRLPDIDTTLHTPDVIKQLQTRAMKVD